jgi:uncharacterized protein
MPLRSIADVNVLLPLVIPAHPSHKAALAWFAEQPQASVGWCVLTQLGVLRLLSNARVATTGALSPDAALAVWEQLVSLAPFCELDQVPRTLTESLRRLAAARQPSINLWTDAWLAALAQSLGCEMVTFDRGFRSFRGLKLRLLTAV